MSERILRALMQLFAILAKVDYSSNHETVSDEIEVNEQRNVVANFLLNELNSSQIEKYLTFFDENIALLNSRRGRKDGANKKTSVNSVKILRICSDINKELTLVQKKIVFIRILEFVRINKFTSQQINDFVSTVSESFSISNEKAGLLQTFVNAKLNEKLDDPRIVYVSSNELNLDFSKHIKHENLDAEIRVLRLESLNQLFIKYYGQDQLILNGQTVIKDRVQILSNGASLRTSKSNQVYYSDIISNFLSDEKREKVILRADELSYKFENGIYGIHPISFQAEGGSLIGIMGSSGAGKSTLLNVLNGNLKPSSGSIRLNGIDLKESKSLEGKIGYISQDDLLIEELTVFQNLFYNAQLSYKSKSTQDIQKKVVDALRVVGLYHIKNLKVGGPLNSSISGGQRKRLNIAIELIRQPAVLFVDEPTSGLSSRDSESIMDLLKELSLKGKLIFVVIHQPSSEIFKMFDRLLIMDVGGYSIFDGKPSDASVYFKVHANHAGAEEFECSECGKVNPEEIFNIVEAKVVDELGNITSTRKTSPKEWHNKYVNEIAPIPKEVERHDFQKFIEKPSLWTQFKVYFQRDLLSKVSNKQYVFLNLLEAPALAILLAFFLKFFGLKNEGEMQYSFYHNENIPQYIFICVIVSFFLGLAVSAEEIIKDKILLKREKFLHLSRNSYLLSKASVLFLISAIQSFLFVVVGNLILEIPNMIWDFWIVLFSTACMANVLGLLVSSTFSSAKVAYIFIPLLIIPQLLFSGVIVKYDRLHPVITSEKDVPWIGNLMTSRWAYEGLVVNLFYNNPIETDLFERHKNMDEASWKKDYWFPEMNRNLGVIEKKEANSKRKIVSAAILKNEIELETKKWRNFTCTNCDLSAEYPNTSTIKAYLARLKKYYDQVYQKESLEIESYKREMGEDDFWAANVRYSNESIDRLVKNSNEFDKLIVSNSNLIQKSNPIYRNTESMRFLDAPFYSPNKNFMGVQISTYWSNIIVIWFFSILLYIFLYFDWFNKFVNKRWYKK
jgi:ABC transport system ATP-binding/permease protein